MIEDGQPACVLEQLVPDATERAERRAPTGEGWYFDDYTPNTELECDEGEAPWQAISYATRFTGFVWGRFHCTEPVFWLTWEWSISAEPRRASRRRSGARSRSVTGVAARCTRGHSSSAVASARASCSNAGTPQRSVHARADQSDVMAKVFVALTGLGFRQREAQRMIDTVRVRANIGYDIDAVMKAALEEAPLSCVREATTLYRRVA